MCGLAGILVGRADEPGARAGLLERMNAAQAHRGPDQSGAHHEARVSLGHQRLSIIDLAAGQQPLANEDGDVLTVYNGEIYNHEPLRRELQERGHRFRTRCDTEVIVHAWEEWGERCVERLRGMFSLAVWDRRRGRLFLARDRLGIKPLCYAELPDGRLLFASEIKALLACPELPRTLDPAAVEEYFAFGYVPEPRSLFAAVRKLPPGHTLTVTPGLPLGEPRQYWDVAFEADPAWGEEAAAEALLERLREAVRLRMAADVPLGAFLSGGVDSSAVTALMSELSDRPVDACSIGFGERRYDEAEHARAVAGHLGLRHHLDTVEPERFALIDELARLYDEPFADSSALPTYEVSRLTRCRVTVALSGDGGDELLAGYRRYRGYAREQRLRGRLPAPLRRAVFGPLGRCYPKADWAPRALRGKATFQALAADPVTGYLRSVALLDDASRRRLFSGRLRGELQGYHAGEVLRRHAAATHAPERDPVAFAQYLDLKTWLPGDILTKVDRASMAHALEVRVPLLDHQLVEWAATLPSSLKVRGGEGKYLLKRALEPRLPRGALYRRKQGFELPVAEWLRGPLRGRLRGAVLGERLADSGLFDPGCLRRLVDEHQAGRANHARALWSLLMFESFLRQRVEEVAV
ncbi:XrtA/PEP-CTERM system amidotransferase [Halorhodospira neutriphila]|uniref:asparagine synthase (glutamine-hydrolyzing) n=1 Tax=Halorhodospira neutriphila TaxID=168379 RepID=A0ABS1E8K0_9GAMM|nr:asparagine synthetase B [Halorhodospira neutriphila]